MNGNWINSFVCSAVQRNMAQIGLKDTFIINVIDMEDFPFHGIINEKHCDQCIAV